MNSLWDGRRFRIVKGSPGFGFKVRIPAALRSWTEEQVRVRVAGMGIRSLMDIPIHLDILPFYAG